MRSYRSSLSNVRTWLTVIGPTGLVVVLGSLACVIEVPEEELGASLLGTPLVTVATGEFAADGRLVYGEQIEVAIAHDPCDGELTLEANGTVVERWTRSYYGTTQAEAVVDVSTLTSDRVYATEVLFSARLDCFEGQTQGWSELVRVVPTVAEIASDTSNLVMSESGLFSWDLDRFASVTTQNAEVKVVESAPTTLRNVVSAVRTLGPERLAVEDTRGDLNIYTTEPLDLSWAASDTEYTTIASALHTAEAGEQIWTVDVDASEALTLSERTVSDGEALWRVGLETEDKALELLAGPVLSADASSVRAVLVSESSDGRYELLEAVVELESEPKSVVWESLRISSRKPNADVVAYTDDRALLMLDVVDDTQGPVLLALSRAEGQSSWQFPVDSELVRWGVFGDNTLWVATTTTFYVVDREGQSDRAASLDGIIERVLPDPAGTRGAIVVTQQPQASANQARWQWLGAELELILDLPVTTSTFGFLWEPGRAPLVVMSANVLGPPLTSDFALVRLPEQSLAPPDATRSTESE